MSLPDLQRDILAHAVNERLDALNSPAPRAPYRGPATGTADEGTEPDQPRPRGGRFAGGTSVRALRRRPAKRHAGHFKSVLARMRPPPIRVSLAASTLDYGRPGSGFWSCLPDRPPARRRHDRAPARFRRHSRRRPRPRSSALMIRRSSDAASSSAGSWLSASACLSCRRSPVGTCGQCRNV
jgi:hypothetical protein